MPQVCIVHDCFDNRAGRGYCKKHWQRWRKHGRVDVTRPSALDRLAEKAEQDGDCWRWTGASEAYGYGRVYFEGRVVPAHRLMYQQLVGEVPEGLVLDHLCCNPWCVNPYHLDPVPHGVNIQRGYDQKRLRKVG